MSTTNTPTTKSSWLPSAYGVILALVGLALLLGGLRLVTLGGSWYYLIAGLLTVVSGVLLFKRNPNGGLLYLVVVIGTVIWALGEVGPISGRWYPVWLLCWCWVSLLRCAPVCCRTSKTRSPCPLLLCKPWWW